MTSLQDVLVGVYLAAVGSRPAAQSLSTSAIEGITSC
jgi:hypothetical protein